MGSKIKKLEGGSGGKRGHSQMNHWNYTEDIKAQTKRKRRRIEKKIIKENLE